MIRNNFIKKILKVTNGQYISKNIKIIDLLVNSNNMNLAFNKKKGKSNISKTNSKLTILQMKDGSLYLSNGHHRVIDYVFNNINTLDLKDMALPGDILTLPKCSTIDGYIPFKTWYHSI